MSTIESDSKALDMTNMEHIVRIDPLFRRTSAVFDTDDGNESLLLHQSGIRLVFCSVVNPRRACAARVTVLTVSVCLCVYVSVCYH